MCTHTPTESPVTFPHNLPSLCRVYKNPVFQASLWLLSFQLPQAGTSIYSADVKWCSVWAPLFRCQGDNLMNVAHRGEAETLKVCGFYTPC